MNLHKLQNCRARTGRLVIDWLSLNTSHPDPEHAWSAAALHSAVMIWSGQRSDDPRLSLVKPEHEAFQKVYSLLMEFLLLVRLKKIMEEHRAVVSDLEKSLIERFGPARGVAVGTEQEAVHA